MKETLSNIWFLSKYIFRYGPSAYILVVFNAVFHTFSILLNIFGIKYILDALTNGLNWNRLIYLVAIYSICWLVSKVYFTFSDYYTSKIYSLMSKRMDIEMMQKANSIDYACFDDPDFYDNHTRAMSAASGALNTLVSTYTAILSNLISVVTIASFVGSMGVQYLIIASINVLVSCIVIIKKNKNQFDYEQATTSINRRLGYFKMIMFNQSAIKEIRVNNASDLLKNKFHVSFSEWYSKFIKNKTNIARLDYLENVSSAVTYFLTMLFAVSDVYNNVLSLGAYVSAINAVQSLTQQLSSLVFQIPTLVQQSKYINNMRILLDLPCVIERSLPTQTILEPKSCYQVDFVDVTFAYPGTSDKILDHVSFSIRSGEKTVLVGENGAGKTTIIKLLLRLYDPQEGSILIDGKNIREIDVTSLRRGLGIVFQDSTIFSLSIKENILLGLPQENEIIAEEALKGIGLYNKVHSASDGINNEVTRLFDDKGIVFSGGEQQKIAIARALCKKAGLVIMDEPSSALDPNSEFEMHCLMESILNGATTLIVSHRLSMCLTADQILVLSKGCICERGTHNELMKHKGEYFEMFEKQASSYQEGMI